MKRPQFEDYLNEVVEALAERVEASTKHHEGGPFQKLVLQVMQQVAGARKLQIMPTNHPHAFPDIKANGFGVEVKSTRQDTWDATANSILESLRDHDAREVYLVFGKMGGMPGVRWRRYEEAIHHVRISHAPRFVVGMDTPPEKSLFRVIGMSYEDFAKKTPTQKMDEVRKYARSRRKPGEGIWWLEDKHTVDLKIRRYQELTKREQMKLAGECAALCPEIVQHGRNKTKYSAALKFAASYYGILCSRDMYSAGSVEGLVKRLNALRGDMMTAFRDLDPKLLEEFWPEGAEIPADAEGRKEKWLELADVRANGWWTPSERLFL